MQGALDPTAFHAEQEPRSAVVLLSQCCLALYKESPNYLPCGHSSSLGPGVSLGRAGCSIQSQGFFVQRLRFGELHLQRGQVV